MKLSECTEADIGKTVTLTDHLGERTGVLTRVTRRSGDTNTRVHFRHGLTRNGFANVSVDRIERVMWALRVEMEVGPWPEALVLYEHGAYNVDVVLH